MNFQNPVSAAWLNVAFLTPALYNPVYVTKWHLERGFRVKPTKSFARYSRVVIFLKSDAWNPWL